MAGRHAKYFKDPYRETYSSYSEQGRANFDKIDWSDGAKAEPEPEPKPRIMAPGPVFRFDMNDLPRDMSMKQIMEMALNGDAPGFVKVIEQKPRE